MPSIDKSRVLIIATNGFEQSELEEPCRQLRAKGAKVVIAAPEDGEINGWKGGDWGSAVPVDMTLDKVEPGDYDALVIPGGVMNPDKLRMNAKAVALVRAFVDSGTVVAAICHGPWLLVEAGAVNGREATSYPSIRTDLINAGARWVDKQVVTSDGIITSRNPGDIDAFVEKIVEEIEEGRHRRAA